MNLLKELIKIESSDRTAANKAVAYAAEYLRRNGIAGQLHDNEGFTSYTAVIGEGEKTLVLNGHLDVVSGSPSQFEPIETEGRITGRGSADMKGGCTAMIQAMIRLKDADLRCRVMLQLVPDEETGGMHGSAYLADQGYLGNFVICTEPTNLRISIQSKGIIIMDIDFEGVAAHGSRPWEGENAILKAMENFAVITRLPILNTGSALYRKSSVNLARISSGDIYNRVPDKCRIGLDIRFVPHLDPEEIVAAIEEAVEGSIRVKVVEAGVNVDPEDPYVKLLKKSLARVCPDEILEYAAQHGGSDTRFFAARGIPAIEFGPKGNFWHGDGEYVETPSVKQLEDILVDFALHFPEG